ncbi:Meckel syndrome type 1 protein isoform X1 [Takifugu flavidus]|uniref:Meckel syndrome type 1 protein isoform X1 n=1 Tax=Takifugu flavidus TaxID=433684 RepID=UPI0025449DA1|nr:Meckel syndrome type 1 protein isoform X1 [Takifugu flavidus]
MTDCWNTDNGEAVFRTRDMVKNLRIKVRVEKVTSTAALSQHLQHQVLSQQQDGGAIELQTLTSQGHKGDNEEELVVGWQEKLFSQYEMELFENEAACQTPLERQYHLEVKALKKARGRRNRRIFTYTDHDRYTNSLPFNQLQYSSILLNTSKSWPTFLAERMTSLRQRGQDQQKIDCGVPKAKIINWEPTEEFVRNTHVVNNVMQTMHIMADLGPPEKLGQKENECLLVTIKTDGSGTVIVKPDFNKGREPYRIVTGEKKEVWRLTVENASTVMKPEQKDREQNIYRDLYTQHMDYLNSLVGQDFEMPPVGVLRYLLNGEIVSAKGFEYDNLYIHFTIELPTNWSGSPNQSLSGVTHTCRTKPMGKEDVAFFSHLFSCEASYTCDKESEGTLLQWPVLYFKVLSLDSWQRCRTEGYGYLLFPAIPGKHTITCHTWRPLQTGTVSALRRFFIGGSPELEDISYVRIPGTFKGERLSRFGFCSETTGNVTFNLHCMQQARSFVDANMLRKKRQRVLNQLGGFSQQGAVSSVQEAFQRARKKMQEAQENLPKDLISSTSQLQIELSSQLKTI